MLIFIPRNALYKWLTISDTKIYKSIENCFISLIKYSEKRNRYKLYGLPSLLLGPLFLKIRFWLLNGIKLTSYIQYGLLLSPNFIQSDPIPIIKLSNRFVVCTVSSYHFLFTFFSNHLYLFLNETFLRT